jgi:acetyl-CoA carboxylase biotin carboxyl carrier protein
MEVIDFDRIKKFINLIENTDIEELVWEKNGVKIAFKRKEKKIGGEAEEQQQQGSSKSADGKEAAEIKKEKPEEKKKLQTIKSTLVGKFYTSLPDRPPLVIEGTHVVPGQKVGVIETMKIFRDVVSDKKGKIVKILVSDGEAVQYGQDLFLIDTESEEG